MSRDEVEVSEEASSVVSSVSRDEEVCYVSRDMASTKAKEPSPPPEEEEKAPEDEEKARAAKRASPSHPPYFQMIKEALMALKARGGSSSHAIAKHVEEGNYKSALPAHFRKILKVQLKNCVDRGRLIKVKGSYKLAEEKKPVASGRGKKPQHSDAAVPRHKGKASGR